MAAVIDPHCTRCTLHTTRTQVVQPVLPSGMRVLFVGRDPGAIEDAEGTPFHPDAPAGKMLRRTIADVGIPIDWCGFMNTVACHTPGNRGPNVEELTACLPWRIQTSMQAHRHGARLYVLLGAEAVEARFNLTSYKQSKVKGGKGVYPLADWHGKVVQDVGGVSTMAAYHPSAALRSNEMRRAFVGDMKAVAALLGVEPNVPPITNVWDARPPTTVTIAVDVETVSLTDRTLLGIGIAYRDRGRSEEVHGAWYSRDTGRINDGLAVLRRHRGPIVMANAKFDWDVINQTGYSIPTRQLEDVMLKAYVLRREQEVGSLGLKELALADLGYTWTTLSDMGQEPSDLTDSELGQYCLYDCAATLYLNELYDRRLDE